MYTCYYFQNDLYLKLPINFDLVSILSEHIQETSEELIFDSAPCKDSRNRLLNFRMHFHKLTFTFLNMYKFRVQFYLILAILFTYFHCRSYAEHTSCSDMFF